MKKKKKSGLSVSGDICLTGFFFFVFLYTGCVSSPPPVVNFDQSGACFKPAAVKFGGLTEILKDPQTKQPKTLRVFIELRDQFDSRLKTPFTVRLELYKYASHSSNPKGEHLKTWPDLVLVDAAVNNLYWRDYLRAYEFLLELDSSIPAGEPLLAAAACWGPDWPRLEATYVFNWQ
jgi:hypothetical protein